MKIGVLSQPCWPQDRSASAAPPHQLELLAIAEEQGFDAAWLAEPDSSRYGIAPSLHLRAAQLASHTTRIRIGMLATILPSFHPLRVAEELAMLDIISGGRLDWAVGCGPEQADGDGLRVFDEQLEVLKQAWTGLPFAHDGEFFQFPTLECVPAPEQDPHPPIHVAARSRAVFEWAGLAGYPVLADAFSSTEDLEECVASHRVHADSSLSLLRLVYCGETTSRAREEARPALLRCIQEHRNGAADEADSDANPDLLVDRLLERCAIVGDAAYCRDRIAELDERVGVDLLLCWQSFGDLPPEASMASQRRLAESLLPAFR